MKTEGLKDAEFEAWLEETLPPEMTPAELADYERWLQSRAHVNEFAVPSEMVKSIDAAGNTAA